MPDGGVLANLVGHDGAKAIIRGAIRARDVHLLLEGPPASGKSVAMLALEEHVPGALYRDASGFSGAELRETLARDPPILLLDEIDDMNKSAYPALTTALENARVQKSTVTRSFDVAITTQVIGACNDRSDLPGELRSRLQFVVFEAYTPEEFDQVAGRVLASHVDWVDNARLARAIGARVRERIPEADIRTARDVAKLAGDFDHVDDIIAALLDSKAEVMSTPLTPAELERLIDTGPRTSDVDRRIGVRGRDTLTVVNEQFDAMVEQPTREQWEGIQAAWAEAAGDVEPTIRADVEEEPEPDGRIRVMVNESVAQAIEDSEQEQTDAAEGQPGIQPDDIFEDSVRHGLRVHYTEADHEAVIDAYAEAAGVDPDDIFDPILDFPDVEPSDEWISDLEGFDYVRVEDLRAVEKFGPYTIAHRDIDSVSELLDALGRHIQGEVIVEQDVFETT